MREYRELQDEEAQALRAFAFAHKGKDWREELSMTYWMNARVWRGPVPGMGEALQRVRNAFGPTWLYDVFRLPKE